MRAQVHHTMDEKKEYPCIHKRKSDFELLSTFRTRRKREKKTHTNDVEKSQSSHQIICLYAQEMVTI